MRVHARARMNLPTTRNRTMRCLKKKIRPKVTDIYILGRMYIDWQLTSFIFFFSRLSVQMQTNKISRQTFQFWTRLENKYDSKWHDFDNDMAHFWVNIFEFISTNILFPSNLIRSINNKNISIWWYFWFM